MANDTEIANYDCNARLVEAIRLLAERVTPRPLHQTALDAIKSHDELTNSLQFVFKEAPASTTDKY
jgi:hypothetical protein